MAGTAFGRQRLSTSASAPSFGFGSADRALREKVSLSDAPSHVNNRGSTPGPAGTRAQPTAGKHALAERVGTPTYVFARADRFPDGKELTPGPGDTGKNAALFETRPQSCRFGKSTRDVSQKLVELEVSASFMHGRHSPGPAYVRGQAAIGTQGTSKRKTAPSFGFGKSERFKHAHVARAHAVPGPGAYNLNRMAIGKEIVSVNDPRVTFGRSTRESASNLFIGEAHSKRGLDSPGPQKHGRLYPLGSIGEPQRQTASRKGFTASFGMSGRFREEHAEHGTPGPGAYAGV